MQLHARQEHCSIVMVSESRTMEQWDLIMDEGLNAVFASKKNNFTSIRFMRYFMQSDLAGEQQGR